MCELKKQIYNEPSPAKEQKKPSWLKSRIPSGDKFFRLRRSLREKGLNTICQSARCPNIDECWNGNHATFLAMGDICCRRCRFCSVPKGEPRKLDLQEDQKILEMVKIMGLSYLVITSVTRDDLPDNGGRHLGKIVETLKKGAPNLLIEMLVPDFCGIWTNLDLVIDEKPDVLSHNLETVRDLYPVVARPEQNYYISLHLLQYAKQREMVTKSGVMVGLGETREQLLELFSDLHRIRVDLLTIGQYLQPSPQSLPVARYYLPEEFEELKQTALSFGFSGVESGPFVRSSYHADLLFQTVHHEISRI